MTNIGHGRTVEVRINDRGPAVTERVIDDGYTLLARVRALGLDRGGRLPAVALTAFARAEDRDRALAVGYAVHVPKPVEPAAR